MKPIDLLKGGYAEYFHVSPDCFDTTGLRMVETTLRDQPVWEKWCMPVWMVSIQSSILCCVSPRYSEGIRSVFRSCSGHSLCDPVLLQQCQEYFGQDGWHSYEILYYPHHDPPTATTPINIQKLNAGHPEAKSYFQDFTSGIYVIQDQERNILCWAGVKDHRLIQELAVNTEPEHRRKGFARALIARAVTDILARGQAAVYIPDAPENLASYSLAKSLGFEKVGEMLYWEVQAQAGNP